MNTYEEILHFWFVELKPEQWFYKDDAVDERIRQRFSDVHQQAHAGELYTWRLTPEGRLAEILVLDQFSRNIFRGTQAAFASDPIALILAQEAIFNKAHANFDIEKKAFMFMPYMHSESKPIHEIAVRLFSEPGLEDNLKYELLHKSIIDKFGRYPHRNEILGRKSTPEEIEFLKTPGSSF
jgi:uncharacterized protein (DUF924 family)